MMNGSDRTSVYCSSGKDFLPLPCGDSCLSSPCRLNNAQKFFILGCVVEMVDTSQLNVWRQRYSVVPISARTNRQTAAFLQWRFESFRTHCFTTRRPAQGWRFILIGRSCQPARLTARLDGSSEPRNQKPLHENREGHALDFDRK